MAYRPWRLTQGELFPRVGFIVTNMSAGPEGVVHFYNGRGTAEQWIKEGKYALNWTRLSCHRFVANQVRLALFILAYNLGNLLRRLCLPRAVKHWSLRSLQVKLIICYHVHTPSGWLWGPWQRPHSVGQPVLFRSYLTLHNAAYKLSRVSRA